MGKDKELKRRRRIKCLHRINGLLDDMQQETMRSDCDAHKYSCNTIETISELRGLIAQLIRVEENE